MQGFEIVVVVIVGLFAVGMLGGMLLVALPLFRSMRRRHRDHGYLEGGSRLGAVGNPRGRRATAALPRRISPSP